MKNTIVWFILSCTMTPYFIGNSLARDLVASCDEEYEDCATSCIQRYSTPTYDVWDHMRRESYITRALRDKCKNFCLIGHKKCIRHAQKRENEEKKQEELENQVRIKQEEPTTSPPLLPSDNKTYKWTDKNGVIHLTNDKDSIPAEYLEQVERGSNKETKVIGNKNKTNSKNINTKTE